MKHNIAALLLVFFASFNLWAAPPAKEEGKTIFASRCASCHNVNKVLTGPALAGVDQRHDIDWIINFVHSSQTVIKGGDAKAVALFEKFNKIPMPDHTDLTADNIKSIVEYVKSEAGAEEKAPFVKPSKLHPNYTPISINNYGFFASYLAIVVLLIGALLLLVRVKEFERNAKGKSA